jgi:hypothetical protein
MAGAVDMTRDHPGTAEHLVLSLSGGCRVDATVRRWN